MLPKISPFGFLLQRPHKNALLPRSFVKANIVVGSMTKKCAGHGICKVLIASAAGMQQCQSVPAIIEADESGALWFKFEKGQMCSNMRKRQFSQDVFIMEEDFVLPGWVREMLSPASARLRKGRYPMWENEAYFVARIG